MPRHNEIFFVLKFRSFVRVAVLSGKKMKGNNFFDQNFPNMTEK